MGRVLADQILTLLRTRCSYIYACIFVVVLFLHFVLLLYIYFFKGMGFFVFMLLFIFTKKKKKWCVPPEISGLWCLHILTSKNNVKVSELWWKSRIMVISTQVLLFSFLSTCWCCSVFIVNEYFAHMKSIKCWLCNVHLYHCRWPTGYKKSRLCILFFWWLWHVLMCFWSQHNVSIGIYSGIARARSFRHFMTAWTPV